MKIVKNKALVITLHATPYRRVQTLIASLAALLLICASFRQAPKTEIDEATLLRNSIQMKPFNWIAEYGGQVYSPFEKEIPAGRIRIPDFQDKFAVVKSAILHAGSDGIEHPYMMFRSDMEGMNTEIVSGNMDPSSLRVFGDRIIYAGRNEQTDENAFFFYDVRESKNTYLTESYPNSLISCDDDFFYFKNVKTGEVLRIRWDGKKQEVLQGLTFPDNLYSIEDEYYYCVLERNESGTKEISVYTIDGSVLQDKYTLATENFITLKEGWAYYGDEKGIFKKNLNTGQTIKLADIELGISNNLMGIGYVIGMVFDNYLYLDVCSYDRNADDSYFTVRFYRLPADGGTMEFLDIEWLTEALMRY